MRTSRDYSEVLWNWLIHQKSWSKLHSLHLSPSESFSSKHQFPPIEISRWWRHDQHVFVIPPCWLVRPTFQSARLRFIFSARVFEICKHKRETKKNISSMNLVKVLKKAEFGNFSTVGQGMNGPSVDPMARFKSLFPIDFERICYFHHELLSSPVSKC